MHDGDKLASDGIFLGVVSASDGLKLRTDVTGVATVGRSLSTLDEPPLPRDNTQLLVSALLLLISAAVRSVAAT